MTPNQKLYAMRDTVTGYVKIGISNDPQARAGCYGRGCPTLFFKSPKVTTNWKLSSRFDNYAQGCIARDNYAKVSENVVVRMVKADTEGQARGKSGVAWNSLANDPSY